MKITEWIKVGSILAVMSFSKALAAPGMDADAGASNLSQSVRQLDQFVQKIKSGDTGKQSSGYRWRELEDFQTKIWKAMALDPAPFAYVPVAQVPKNLFAAELNQELIQEWAELKKSPTPKDFRAQFEFEQYASDVEQIINFRKTRKFPAARAIAKRGILDTHFQALTKKIAQNSDSKISNGGVYLTPSQVTQLDLIAKNAKDQVTEQEQGNTKKNVFAQGGKFIMLILVAICGFAIGIAAYRFNPKVFQQYLDGTTENKPLQSAEKLDYVKWLKQFEDALHRLKASQVIHERRIEELVANSEKIHQHALSLHSDARIKNEANLEHRMSALIKEIHQQIDQAQKLQAADRIQIQSMLEHCLMLCDAVENDAILIDQGKLNEPNPIINRINQ